MPGSPEQATERYLRSGEHDAHFRTWPGNDFLARVHCGQAALRSALIAAVHSRTQHIAFPKAVANIHIVACTREKVAPMCVACSRLVSRRRSSICSNARSFFSLRPRSMRSCKARDGWPPPGIWRTSIWLDWARTCLPSMLPACWD